MFHTEQQARNSSDHCVFQCDAKFVTFYLILFLFPTIFVVAIWVWCPSSLDHQFILDLCTSNKAQFKTSTLRTEKHILSTDLNNLLLSAKNRTPYNFSRSPNNSLMIMGINREGYDVPTLFPIFHEQYLLAPPNYLSKLVYLSYPRRKSVLLFTQGLNESDVEFCIQGDLKSRVLWTKNIRLMRDCCVIAVDCERHSSWSDGRPVTVGKNDNHVFPSTAYLHSALMSRPSGPKYSFCAMTQVRDAAKFVPDWVSYHRRIGIDHFYIFDNNSTEAYAQDPDVEYISFPWRKSQFQALMYGVQMTRSRCQWLAVLDVDEFIYPQGAETVPSIVARLNRSDVGELAFSILKMSSTALGRCPPSSVPEGYLYKQNTTLDIKTSKSIAWSQGLCAHGVHAGIFEKGFKKSRRVVVPSELAYVVHYKVQCWPDFYVSKYKHGRNGLVRDWVNKGYQQHLMPKGWEARHTKRYTLRDTSFRDYFLEVLARPRPQPSVVV